MNRFIRALFAVCLLLTSFATDASAQCVPECRVGYVCNQNQECVSVCNPPCGANEICTAEARCVANPEQQGGYPAQQPVPQPQQTYVQPEPAPAPAETPTVTPPGLAAPGSFRLLLTFDPGFGGGATIDVDGLGSADADLDPTLGARVQGQIPIGSNLYIGLNFGVDGYIGDGAPSSADRLILIGLGVAFGFHYPIELGSFVLEPTAGLALDFAIGTADDVQLDDSAFGFGLGFRGGVNFWFSEIIGAQVNLGVQTHQLFSSEMGTDFRLGLTQFRLGVGGILRFGT